MPSRGPRTCLSVEARCRPRSMRESRWCSRMGWSSTTTGASRGLRSNPKWRSYSVTLRPGIVLKVGETLHLFDARFRIDRWAVEDFEGDAAAAETAENDDRAGRASAIWWKNADIHKMHAYRDALGRDGAHVATVRVLYPGTQEVFYPSQPSGGEGVGAIPLQPMGDRASLAAILASLLTPSDRV